MTYKMPTFQIEFNKKGNFSSMGGGVIIPAVFEKIGLQKAIDENIGACKANGSLKYTDSSYIQSLVTMQILGGEAVDDMKRIREDNVLPDVLGGIPGKTSIHNYIGNFVDEKEEEKRGQGKAFVPEPNEYLKGLLALNLFCRFQPTIHYFCTSRDSEAYKWMRIQHHF